MKERFLANLAGYALRLLHERRDAVAGFGELGAGYGGGDAEANETPVRPSGR